MQNIVTRELLTAQKVNHKAMAILAGLSEIIISIIKKRSFSSSLYKTVLSMLMSYVALVVGVLVEMYGKRFLDKSAVTLDKLNLIAIKSVNKITKKKVKIIDPKKVTNFKNTFGKKYKKSFKNTSGSSYNRTLCFWVFIFKNMVVIVNS